MRARRASRHLPTLVALVVLVGPLVTACRVSPPSDAAAPGDRIRAVASINAWGSILSQLGGARVTTTSIVTNPNTDPHDYEPTPADGRAIADASVVVENGIGYDPWAAKTIAATGRAHQLVVNVGRVVGIAAGGNPHRWYAPSDVERVADAITADLARVDPADAGYFRQRRTVFERSLSSYHALIARIASTYAGTPVGASESIFSPLAQALKLDVVTPSGFLTDISEGSEPSAADKTTIDSQLARHAIKVYVLNRQNETPDVAAQVATARREGIPVTAVTETLSPAGATFQAWQVGQLRALAAALARATGR
jgi:zinc/manganese transport system substrate-binding protein